MDSTDSLETAPGRHGSIAAINQPHPRHAAFPQVIG